MLARMLGIRPYRKARVRTWSQAILVTGILTALAAGGLTYRYVEEIRRTALTPGPTVAVLIAARDIPARSRISASDLQLGVIDPAFLPSGALSSPGDAVGRVTAIDLAAREPVLATKLIAAGQQDFSVLGPDERITPSSPDLRALSISVPDAGAVGGVLKAGDVIDILVAVRLGNDPATAELSARVAFQKVQILARKDTIYTIRVDAADAERIAYLDASGAALRFLLRAPGDGRDSRATGADGTTIGPLLRIGGAGP